MHNADLAELFGCLLSEHWPLTSNMFTEYAEQFPIHEYRHGSTHRDPHRIAVPSPGRPLRWDRWHPDRPASLVSTEAGGSFRSILASVPLSMSIKATCDVHMYTPGNVLHVRVVLKAVGSMTCDMDAWLVDHGVAVMLT